ncbi:MAG: lipase [Rhodospirillaceae bacterium]|nr:lipase [Rhodospirillales bacterium]
MRICFLGDSFVNGTNDPHCLGWVGRVVAHARADGCDLTCYNLGIRRDTSVNVAARWQTETALRLPQDVDGRLVFSFGVNDCCDEDGRRRVPLGTTLETAHRMLTEVRHPTLMVGPPPIAEAAINARIGELSAALAALCGELHVPYLETFTPLAANPVWMTEIAATDGAHPGAAGYGVLAELVQDWAAWHEWVG